MELTLQVKLKIEDEEGKASIEQLTEDAVFSIKNALQDCYNMGFPHLIETTSIEILSVGHATAPLTRLANKKRRRPDGKAWFKCPKCGNVQGHKASELQVIGDPFCNECGCERMNGTRRPRK